jgi:positive regulator of sigma E activity
MIDIIVFLLILVSIAIVISIIFPNLRPLIAGLIIVYLSLPIYLFIATLPIDSRLRIALQLIAFSFLIFIALYVTLKEYRRRIRIPQKGYPVTVYSYSII